MDSFLQTLTFNEWVELIGTLIGLVYIYYQYIASPKFWYVSAVNALPFIYLFFVKGNYASALLYTYYLTVALQAILLPKNDTDGSGTFLIRTIPARLYPRLALATAALFGVLYAFLLNLEPLVHSVFPAAPVTLPLTPAADAFATALSFVSMWLLSKKYLEQWLSWVVVNTVFVYLGLSMGSWQWAALYALYGLVAVMGFFNWRRLLHRQRTAQPQQL